jgi:hypothetical protein
MDRCLPTKINFEEQVIASHFSFEISFAASIKDEGTTDVLILFRKELRSSTKEHVAF